MEEIDLEKNDTQEPSESVIPHESLLNLLKPGDHIATRRKNGLFDHHGIFVGDDEVIHLQGPGKNRGDHPTCKTCGYLPPKKGKIVKSCIACFCRGQSLTIVEYKIPIRLENLNDDIMGSLIPGKAIYAYKSNEIYLRLYKDGELYGHLNISKQLDYDYWGIDNEIYCYEYDYSSAKPLNQVVETATRLLTDGFAKYNLVFGNCEHFVTYCTIGFCISIQVGKWFGGGIGFAFLKQNQKSGDISGPRKYKPRLYIAFPEDRLVVKKKRNLLKALKEQKTNETYCLRKRHKIRLGFYCLTECIRFPLTSYFLSLYLGELWDWPHDPLA